MSFDAAVFLGIFSCALASVMTNVGLLLQKRFFMVQGWDTRAGGLGCFPRRLLWVLGLCLFLCGHGLHAFSLGLAPQSVLSCLGALCLVWNALLAPWLVGERNSRKSLTATAAILGGCVIAVVCGGESRSMKMHAEQLPLLFQSNACGLCVLLFVVCALTAVAVVHWMRGVQPVLGPVSFGILSAAVGALSVICMKCVSQIVLTAAAEARPVIAMDSAGPFIALAVAAVIFAVSSVCVINVAISAFDALCIIPIYYAMAVVFQVVSGGIFFAEFETFSLLQAVGFSFGVLLTVTGIWAISHTLPLSDQLPNSTDDAVCGSAAAKQHKPGHMQRQASDDSAGFSSASTSAASPTDAGCRGATSDFD